MAHNGPAVIISKRYPTPAPMCIVSFRRISVRAQGGYGMCFCIHGRNFVELEPFRGTSFIGARKLSPVTKLLAGTGAVSRYNVSRSQRFVTVQESN